MKTNKKTRKPTQRQPMGGDTGTKPITGPLNPKRLLRQLPRKKAQNKPEK